MIAAILFTIAFTFFFYLHEKYRIKDEQTPELETSNYLKKQWHKYKGGVQFVFFGFIFYVSFTNESNWLYAVGMALFCASFFWLFHDGFLNSYVFKKEWWYVGSTGSIDKKLGRTAISIMKVVFLAVSIIMLIVWKIFY